MYVTQPAAGDFSSTTFVATTNPLQQRICGHGSYKHLQKKAGFFLQALVTFYNSTRLTYTFAHGQY
jgi:hypothetical protein